MRLQEMAQQMGQVLHLSFHQLIELDLLVRLHDLGKIAIPQNILNKPGPLSPEEWEKVKQHPEIGYRIAQSSPDLISIGESILAVSYTHLLPFLINLFHLQYKKLILWLLTSFFNQPF